MRKEIAALLEREAREGFKNLHVDDMKTLREAFHAGEIPVYRFAWSFYAPHVQKRLYHDSERYTLDDARRTLQRVKDAVRADGTYIALHIEREPIETWVNT